MPVVGPCIPTVAIPLPTTEFYVNWTNDYSWPWWDEELALGYDLTFHPDWFRKRITASRIIDHGVMRALIAYLDGDTIVIGHRYFEWIDYETDYIDDCGNTFSVRKRQMWSRVYTRRLPKPTDWEWPPTGGTEMPDPPGGDSGNPPTPTEPGVTPMGPSEGDKPRCYVPYTTGMWVGNAYKEELIDGKWVLTYFEEWNQHFEKYPTFMNCYSIDELWQRHPDALSIEGESCEEGPVKSLQVGLILMKRATRICKVRVYLPCDKFAE